MIKPLLSKSALVALVVLAALAAPVVRAGGLYGYEIDPANTLRPKAAWLNPAGMSGVDRMSVEATLAIVSPKVEFESTIATAGGSDGGNAADGFALPDVSFVMPLNERMRFGVALTGLFGGAVDFGTNFVGRYSMIESELGGIGIVPSFSYKVNDKFSVGVGAALVRTTFDETIAINNNNVPVLDNAPLTPDGRVVFDKLDDTGVQPILGITCRFNPKVMFGAVYRGKMDLTLEGDAVVTGLVFEDTPVATVTRPAMIEWTNPQTLEFGVEIGLNQRSFLSINADWEDWSEFSDNSLALDLTNPNLPSSATVNRQWEDTQHYGVSFSRLMGKNLLSVGVSHDTSPVEDVDRTFDLAIDSKSSVSAGYVWGGNPNRQYAVGGALVFMGNGAIDQTSQGLQTAGEFDKNSAFMLAGTFVWKKAK